MKLDAVWEDGSEKLVASGKNGSEEACEEVYEEACEDDSKDNCESIRGLFGLPLVLVVGSCFFKCGRPLLSAVRVSPNGVLSVLVWVFVGGQQ